MAQVLPESTTSAWAVRHPAAKAPLHSFPVFYSILPSKAQRHLDVEGPGVPPGGKIALGLGGLCGWWGRKCGRWEGEAGMSLSLACCHSVLLGV